MMQISLGPWILDPGISYLLSAALNVLHFRHSATGSTFTISNVAKIYSNQFICPNLNYVFRVKIDQHIALLTL